MDRTPPKHKKAALQDYKTPKKTARRTIISNSSTDDEISAKISEMYRKEADGVSSSDANEGELHRKQPPERRKSLRTKTPTKRLTIDRTPPKHKKAALQDYKTPKKTARRTTISNSSTDDEISAKISEKDLKEADGVSSSDANEGELYRKQPPETRKSLRTKTPTKRLTIDRTPPKHKKAALQDYQTPKKTARRTTISNSSTDDEISAKISEKNRKETVGIASSDANEGKLHRKQPPERRKSLRTKTPTKRYDFVSEPKARKRGKSNAPCTSTSEETADAETEEIVAAINAPSEQDIELVQADYRVEGRSMFGFNTPKKRDGMAVAAANTPKTPRTPKTPHTPKTSRQKVAKIPESKRRRSTVNPKTPSRLRHQVKKQIAKLLDDNLAESDFSEDASDYEPSTDTDSSSASGDNSDNSVGETPDEDARKPVRTRRPVHVPVLPKTPTAARQRQSARMKKAAEYVPESEVYFQSHATGKALTSDHTLDRLKNPRLPADRLFSLLAKMKLSSEHETAINAMMEEYRSYFSKWLCLLSEGFNIMIYGLGSKRQLLQAFHRDLLAQQTVLIVNGFFPSLTIKDVLDSIIREILDVEFGISQPHEAVNLIQEEFALIPDTHLYLIVHNLDGVMLRNSKAQSTFARLAKVPNIHLIASIDHINTPLLWDHSKLSNFNFSWWDCSTMLPYTVETSFENSLLVHNSGALALSSMRSVFSSLTSNARGIFMLIVKHQLQHKANANYQGMAFKDLYWSCREAFLVSSDLALRAQLTEFLDHKMIKSKRSADGSEQLTIPIDVTLLQQFLDEQDKK